MIIKCAYCGKKIVNQKRPNDDKDYQKAYRSSEHIIQNAIGGKCKSSDICCDRCNYHIEHLIDKKFCDIFVPFTSSIPNFATSRKTANAPYSGYIYNSQLEENAIFSAESIKGMSPRSSNELIYRLKEKDVTNLNSLKNQMLNDSRILFSDFKLDNITFKNGLAKIAFNFAISSGIDPDKLKSFIKIVLSQDTGEIKNISFNTQLIPFVALNDFDKSIEFSQFNDEFPPFHNIILFRHQTQLWCFINLFDTFQWYVKMSDDYLNDYEVECEVINSLFQFIQSYPSKTENEKTTQIKKTPALSDTDIFLYKKIAKFAKQDEITDFYLNSNHGGFENKYHIICASTNLERNRLFGMFYPMCIQDIQKDIYNPRHIVIRDYTVKKFMRLSHYSNTSKPNLNQEFFDSLSDNDLNKFIELYDQSRVSNRVTKQIDLNLIFPDDSNFPTEECIIKEIISENYTALKLQYDGNVNIEFVNRNLGPPTLDFLLIT